jgi:hypothetical protein
LFRFDKLKLKEKPQDLFINWNEKAQLESMADFNYYSELENIPQTNNDKDDYRYYFLNGSYSGFDAEYLYCFLRRLKPQRIIEVGSGFSTRLMKAAQLENEKEVERYSCKITCIEPYEMPWLEKIGVEVI